MNLVTVENLVYRFLDESQLTYLNGTNALKAYGSISTKKTNRITTCYANGTTLSLGNATFAFYNREASYIDDANYVNFSELSTRINLDSLVFKVQYGSTKFLFTGDAGVSTLNYVATNFSSAIASTDVYKVSHHSLSANNQASFLNQVKAKYAIMCTGYTPTEQTLSTTISRLKAANSAVKIYSTQNIKSFVSTANQSSTYTGILVMSNGSSISTHGVYNDDTPLFEYKKKHILKTALV